MATHGQRSGSTDTILQTEQAKDTHRFSSELTTQEPGEGEGILGRGNGFKLLV